MGTLLCWMQKLTDIAKARHQSLQNLEQIREDVKNAAYEIIEKKKSNILWNRCSFNKTCKSNIK